MSAYLIADIDVHDPQTYEEYRRRAPAAIAAFGGRYLARGGATEVLEGTWRPSRVVILEFPTFDDAKRCFASPEYLEIARFRHDSTTSSLILVDGQPGS